MSAVPGHKRLEAIHELCQAASNADCDAIISRLLQQDNFFTAYCLFTRRSFTAKFVRHRYSFGFAKDKLEGLNLEQFNSTLMLSSSPYLVLRCREAETKLPPALDRMSKNLQLDYLISFQNEQACYALVLLQGEPEVLEPEYRLFLASLALALKAMFFSHLAAFDPLTELFSRSYFLQSLRLYHDRLPEGKIVLMMIDIDFFKKINDAHGHVYGDQILKKVCSCLRSNFRDRDLLSRFGGDEFVALLPQTTRNQALRIARRVQNRIRRLKIIQDWRILTVSIGIAIQSRLTGEPEQLISNADAALYRAKTDGRNCIVVDDKNLSPQRLAVDKCSLPGG